MKKFVFTVLTLLSLLISFHSEVKAQQEFMDKERVLTIYYSMQIGEVIEKNPSHPCIKKIEVQEDAEYFYLNEYIILIKFREEFDMAVSEKINVRTRFLAVDIAGIEVSREFLKSTLECMNIIEDQKGSPHYREAKPITSLHICSDVMGIFYSQKQLCDFSTNPTSPLPYSSYF